MWNYPLELMATIAFTYFVKYSIMMLGDKAAAQI